MRVASILIGQRPFSRNSDFEIAARNHRIDCLNDEVGSALNSRPTRGRQDNDCDASVGKVLLIPQVSVGSNEQFETVGLGGIEQEAIGQLRPAALICGDDLMPGQVAPQRNWSTLIEKNAHLRRR